MPDSLLDISSDHRVTSIEQLETLYETALPQSLAKEIGHISDHYQAFIEASPFVLVATVGPDGLDC